MCKSWLSRIVVVAMSALLIAACGDANQQPPPSVSSSPRVSDSPTPHPSLMPTPGSDVPAVVAVDSGQHVQAGDLTDTGHGWLLVGSLDGQPRLWTSGDGVTWQREDIGPTGERPGHMSAVTAHGDGWLAVGWTSVQVAGGMRDRPFVVAGKPGGAWVTGDDLPMPPQTGGLLTDVTSSINEIVVVGTLSDGTPSAWRSTDTGVSWEGPAALSERGSSVAAVGYVVGQYVAVGERIGSVTGMGIWRSVDGMTWTGDDSPLPGGLADVALTPSGFVAVGHDGAGSAAVISLADSTRRALLPPDLPDLTQVTILGDRLVVSTSSAGDTPVWVQDNSLWEPLPLNGVEMGAVRALAASGSGIGVASDDGTGIRFLRLASGMD